MSYHVSSAQGTDTVYTRILVPLDGSRLAEEALPHAVQMADIFGAELILLRAAFLPPAPALDMAEIQRALISESEAYLNAIAPRFQRSGRQAHTAVRWGKAAEAIIAYATEPAISVVVMATHGHSGLEHWPLGSVAEKVLRSMQVPLLLVRPAQAL